MSQISNIGHVLLTENIVQILKENDIHDAIDFLEKDEDKLVGITNLTYENISEIRQHIFHISDIASVSGFEFYEKNKNIVPYTTGISRLDDVLGGGLVCGKIIEVCGLPNSGKTQLALTISCNIARILKSNVIYVDTKNDFSAARVFQILKKSGCEENELILCLNRIKVTRIWNMHELIYFFHDLQRKEETRKSTSVIIIDSLPSLMLQHHGEKSKESIGLLNIFVNIARFIGDKYSISIIVINLITRWKELNKNGDGEDDNTVWVEKKIPTLGKYWQIIPYSYIQLENDAVQRNKLLISIKNSEDTKYGDKISFEINENGIS